MQHIDQCTDTKTGAISNLNSERNSTLTNWKDIITVEENNLFYLNKLKGLAMSDCQITLVFDHEQFVFLKQVCLVLFSYEIQYPINLNPGF